MKLFLSERFLSIDNKSGKKIDHNPKKRKKESLDDIERRVHELQEENRELQAHLVYKIFLYLIFYKFFVLFDSYASLRGRLKFKDKGSIWRNQWL